MMTVTPTTSRFSRIAGLCRALLLPVLLCVSLFATGTRPGPYSSGRDLTDTAADTTNVEAEICTGQFYTFGDQQLTLSGTYTETFEASDGSDSTVVLVLTVLPAPVTDLNVTLCEGETYVFDNEPLTTSGTYTATFTTDAGCDSVVNLALKFVPAFEVQKEATICQGDTVFFAGNARTESGIYTDSLKAAGGCDSIVTLLLTVLPESETVLSVGICTGYTYVFFDDTLDQTGMYAHTLVAANGCDSIVTLKLLVADYFETDVFATICDGDTYSFAGDDLSVGGMYSDSLLAAGGCDSTIILHLTVLPPNPETNVDVTICDNQTYEFDGNSLNTAGTYSAIFADRNGCDSAVVLHLSVLPTSATTFTATICAGETYEAGGETLDETGDYMFVLPAENGCDSMLTVSLTVLPTFETTLSATICHGETYFFEGDDLDESGTYSATYPAENGCDSTILLHLEILPELFTSLEVTICSGESYPFNGDDLTNAGFYSAILVSELGCDSIVNLALAVAALEETSIEASICAGDSYEFNGENLTESGEYVANLTSEFGCDSTVTLTLTVAGPIPVTEEFSMICSGDTYFFNGFELTEEGTYEVTLTATNGCDSMVVLHLGLIPTVSIELEATICTGESYSFAGTALTMSGIYTDTQTGSNGCDSTTVLMLTVHPLQTTTLDATICAGETYEFDGEGLDESGAYTAVYSDENGCDSTVILHLSVLPLQETALSATICANEIYFFDGAPLNSAGMYTAVYSDENGCDSTVTLVLEVLPTYTTLIEAAICSNEMYEFGGETLFAAGVYEQVLHAENGCDSTVVLTLQVFPVASTSLTAQICSGAAYLFDGQLLTLSGIYTVLLVTESGCDSLVTLELSVADTLESDLSAAICAGESYFFDGQELTESGNYEAYYVAEGGCDSVAVLNLTVLPNLTADIEAVICTNESFEFNGAILTDSGTYSAELVAENGCDSTVTLTLTVLPTFSTDIEATICAGESFNFNGDDLTDNGTYSAELVAGNGCDSIVVLTLTVLPEVLTSESAQICAGETYPFAGQALDQPGVYSAVFSGQNGCDSTVALTLTVVTVNVAVSLQANTLTASATNAAYQWIDCGTNLPVAGANGASFTPAATGSYAVQVTQNGCTDQSVCTEVVIVGTDETWAGGAWRIQPNPARGVAWLQLDRALDTAIEIEIFDLSGRLALQQAAPSGTDRFALELHGLSNGLYLVRLTGGANGSQTKRLVVCGE